jgi:succinyl-CoA synthetase beta subunit
VTSEMPPEEAAEIRKAAIEAIAGNVRVMLCMTGGSVVTMEDCEEYGAAPGRL